MKRTNRGNKMNPVTLEEFVEWTAGLSGGLIIIIDNHKTLTYEQIDKWGLRLARDIELKILHGPYSDTAICNLLLQFFEHTNGNHLYIGLYNTELNDTFMLKDYAHLIKTIRRI